MIESVRPATVEDVDELVRLEHEARTAVSDHRGGPELLAETPEQGAAGFAMLLADPAVRVGVAGIDDVPVGYAIATLAGIAARVGVVYVEPDARELGLGELLLTDLIDWTLAHGGDVIEAIALPGDRETKNMYERFGIKARALIVSKRISDPSTAPDASR